MDRYISIFLDNIFVLLTSDIFFMKQDFPRRTRYLYETENSPTPPCVAAYTLDMWSAVHYL
jgi:hypothetical protein